MVEVNGVTRKMKNVLLLDTETGGVNHKVHKIIEVATILYSLEYASPITSFSALLPVGDNPAESINGIPEGLLKYANTTSMISAVVDELICASDAILAHSASFDMYFMQDVAEEWGVSPSSKPWICTMRDIEWPKKTKHRNLVAIALAHGVPVIAAHRALTDVDILARLLTRVAETGTDLEELVARAMRPKVLVEALVDYPDRDIAYCNGFDWDPQKRQHLREIPEEDIDALPFKCRIIDTNTIVCSGTRQSPTYIKEPESTAG